MNVAALPLQLALRAHPEWRGRPVVIVEEDKPQGLILWVNERAHQQRVRPGMRYAAGLAMAADLVADTLSIEAIEAGVEELAEILRGHSDRVEASEDEPGVFWLNAAGFALLEPSVERWARAIARSLERAGYLARLVLGFHRFSTYALAKAEPSGLSIHEAELEEARAARAVPIDRLGFEPRFRDELERLGIKSLGAFLRLPASGLFDRFGATALRLHKLARGELFAPLDHRAPPEVFEASRELDHPESDAARLLFLVKGALFPLLSRLAARERAVAGLTVELHLENREVVDASVRPAEPTLDEAQLLDLVRLRLETVRLAAGAIRVALLVEAREAPAEQLSLFSRKPRRDPKAAERALARIRAELGPDAVVHAELADAHLPEASFRWVPLDRLRPAEPSNAEPAMVRRFFAHPQPLPSPARALRDDGWLLGGVEAGAVLAKHGPYVVSGGWWIRPVHREYHFAETKRGDLLWVFYDRRRRRWFLHGEVE